MSRNLSNEEFINRWNNQNVHGPTRIDEIDILLEILKSEYKKDTAVLDIGIAAGTIEELVFKNIPEVQIVGIETSPEIINIARMKLRKYADWFEIIQHNLINISSVNLPAKNYSIALSLQTLHNLPHESKKEIISFAAEKLMHGGLFLILDTLAVESPPVFNYYKNIWKYLEKSYGRPVQQGYNYEEYQNNLEERADKPATLEQYLSWLREAGFEPACLCALGNRALFGAKKTGY
jgi:ubiquinone/menaquinone biosynthesis C-methylase UbiE